MNVWLSLVSLMLLLLSTPVGAACSSADAPNNFWSHSCGGLCSYDSATNRWTCDIDNFCSGVGGDLWVVHYDSSSKEYSAFVECHDASSTKACCDIDETLTDPVDEIVALGTDEEDRIDFSWLTASQLLAAFSHDIASLARGGGSDDEIYGSGTNEADYDETLDGEEGNDTVYGFEGHDVLLGGTGNDYLDGGDGADKIWGGLGDDDLIGGVSSDTLCDFTGTTGNCASQHGNYFDGGDGPDTIWYDRTSACTTNGEMDLASTAGEGGVDNDICRDDGDWTEIDTVDWPDFCETPSNVIPAFCDAQY